MKSVILPPVFSSSQECLDYVFKEKTGLSAILTQLLGTEKAKDFLKHIIASEVAGAWFTGTATPDSDLDIDIQVKSIAELDKLLNTFKTNHSTRFLEKSRNIVGFHDHIMIYPGNYKGVRIEINAEEFPPSEQRQFIHSRFTSNYYLSYPEEHERALRLKTMAEASMPGGYRKSTVIIYEDIMRKDLGFSPKRIDTDSLGKSFPKWEGNINPQDWIYLRAKYGIEEAKKIFKKYFSSGTTAIDEKLR